MTHDEILRYDKLLLKNVELRKRVWIYLKKKYGLDSKLKGFQYLEVIISLSLILKKYSRTTIEQLKSYVAYKAGIKDFSVQRQLRYTCTIVTDNKYLPIDICCESWWELRQEIDQGLIEIKGELVENEN